MYNPFCKAYGCGLYRDLGSESYCTIHYHEINLLKKTSDDFDSKIKLSKHLSNDVKCAHKDCIQTDNLVEDAILFNDNIIYKKFCSYHYHQQHRYANGMLTYKCERKGCKRTVTLVETTHNIFCYLHYNKLLEVKNVCNIDTCNKTAKLIHSNDKYWCKKHFNLQTNPEIFSSTEKKKHVWNETTKIRCDFNICNKKTKLILLANGKYSCCKHYYIMIKDVENPEIIPDIKIIEDVNIIEDVKIIPDIKTIEKIKTMEDLENIKMIESVENIKPIKDVENIKNIKDIKWIDVVKTISASKKDSNIYTLLNKCNKQPKLCNSNGKEMCHAHDCKIYKNLYDKYQGQWCYQHKNEITELRNIIDKHDGSKKELKARIKEFQLRKFPDINHFKWIIKLLKDYH